MLQHYKQALALRRQNPLLRSGAMSNIDVIGDAISFQRRGGSGEAIYCAFNLGEACFRAECDGYFVAAVWSSS